MSSENMDTVLDTAEEIISIISNAITPVIDGEKQVNPEGITEGIIETWEELKLRAEEAVSELEVAWVYIQEDPENQDETDETNDDE